MNGAESDRRVMVIKVVASVILCCCVVVVGVAGVSMLLYRGSEKIKQANVDAVILDKHDKLRTKNDEIHNMLRWFPDADHSVMISDYKENEKEIDRLNQELKASSSRLIVLGLEEQECTDSKCQIHGDVEGA